MSLFGGLLNGVGNIVGSLFGGSGGSSFTPTDFSSLTAPAFSGIGDFASGLGSMASGIGGGFNFGNLLGDISQGVGNWVDPLTITAPRQSPPAFGMNDLIPGSGLGSITGAITPFLNGQGMVPYGSQPFQTSDNTGGMGQAQQPQYGQEQITPPLSGQGLVPYNPQQQPAAANNNFDISNLIKGLAGAGLIGSQLLGDNKIGGQDVDALRKLSGDMYGQGNRLMQTSIANQQGHLDAQGQNMIERRLNQTEAGIRQTYNQMGMSGSTMEQQDLMNARESANEQLFTIGNQMATSGFSAASQMIGQASYADTALMQAQIEQDQELTRMIAEYAAAMTK